jgi:hypothetical protein
LFAFPLFVNSTFKHRSPHRTKLLLFLIADNLFKLFVLSRELSSQLFDLEVSELTLRHLYSIIQVLLLQRKNVLLALLHLVLEFIFSFLHVLRHLLLKLSKGFLVVGDDL